MSNADEARPELEQVNEELRREITERRRAEGQITRQAAALDAINCVFREALTCETEEELGKTCLAVAERLTGSKFGFMCEINEGGLLDTIAISDPGWEVCRIAEANARKELSGLEIRGIRGAVIQEGRAMIFNDPSSDPRWVEPPEGHPEVTAFLGVPLRREGEVIGMIGLGNKEPGYELADQEAVESLGAAIVQALMRKRAEDELGRYRGHLEELVEERAAEIARVNEELAEERNLLRTLIDNIPDYIFIKDTESRFVLNNVAHRRILGTATQAEAAGKTDFDVFPEQLAARYHADEQEMMRTARPLVDREEPVTEGSTDTIRWLSTTKVPLHDSQGQIAGLVGISRDITERKRAEEELKRTLEELERSNRELESFAYVVSHDLQEPLRMMSSFARLLSKSYGAKLDERADDFIRRIVDGAKRMKALIDDLLVLSRVGREEEPERVTDCSDAFDLAVGNLQAAIAESGAAVTQEGLPTIVATVPQMVQLFQNLIGNAIKYRGDDPPRVHVTAERLQTTDQKAESPVWQFSVRDNGIGIEPEQLERIFIVFQRLHTRDKYSGTGIGLAICRKIVELKGGRIWAESEPGKGSTLFFTIPERET